MMTAQRDIQLFHPYWDFCLFAESSESRYPGVWDDIREECPNMSEAVHTLVSKPAFKGKKKKNRKCGKKLSETDRKNIIMKKEGMKWDKRKENNGTMQVEK